MKNVYAPVGVATLAPVTSSNVSLYGFKGGFPTEANGL